MMSTRGFNNLSGVTNNNRFNFANKLAQKPTASDRDKISTALGGQLGRDGTFYQFVSTAYYSTQGNMWGAGYVTEQHIN
ncbi:hypothetical protein [Fulvivirga sediminis]|uniref:Uncharacterized protein n=1 Tax=Fulvivirga sediminis TaxID=2803949 RepID=A0A937F9E3_9BACT|nr:hypothetical protein [Fulvivirga sediminis]MBL3656704.1 hypothetical protein [Fulvivirga sediminis]